jgi:hypothetical protein
MRLNFVERHALNPASGKLGAHSLAAPKIDECKPIKVDGGRIAAP